MTFMNYKCQPVALDLLAWRMLVEEPSRFMDQNGNKYLMHWDQKFKYSSAVTKQPNVDAKLSQYYLLFAATWRSNFQFVLVFRRIGRTNVLNPLLRRIAVANDVYC